ncbi:tRNA (guanosine(37)-N1)-methyltransferase TrmD [Texas Phoenix palm phytoplasma]|uniref:tRNA (guanine-N(1)-)-methyltransferase n=1 Tax=Texas Phoenix palm phytoplasma TaxID=176709 RepID=A0ABS5BIG6_9MOLU|nr:tRNA (guanosine(37)-N1)-methyltransferase TrmD [Texas Phoenix palm phytoplasma]MBP3059372.1 tRNA (guanosine(37)-N1)-methyltransferase TrmD [Texas Phoenix palm phytoplasma]
MKFDIITIFPILFDNFLNHSIIKRAIYKKKIIIKVHDLRQYSEKKNNQVDDIPYGGDVGMLMTLPPFYRCLKKIKIYNQKSRVILFSPQGKVLNQKKIFNFVDEFSHFILLCGHYEGIDSRILKYVDEEISIGDYVLTGGEIPSMVFIDSLTRVIPGVIRKESYQKDTFQNGLLKYPQYTRPSNYKNQNVPEILLSGNHKKILEWRQKESLRNTFLKRPDLISSLKLDDCMKKLLEDIKKEEFLK